MDREVEDTDRKPPRRRGAGRPATISREMIIDAVLELGVADMKLPEIARRLNVTTPALYRHIGSMDDLLLGVAARLYETFPAPPDDGRPWDQWAFDFGVMVRDFYAAVPGMVDYGFRRMPRQMEVLLRYETSLRVAARHGAPPGRALDATRAVVDFALAAVARREKQQAAFPSDSHDKDLLNELTAASGRKRSALPLLRRALVSSTGRSQDALFAFQLRALVDGLCRAMTLPQDGLPSVR